MERSKKSDLPTQDTDVSITTEENLRKRKPRFTSIIRIILLVLIFLLIFQLYYVYFGSIFYLPRINSAVFLNNKMNQTPLSTYKLSPDEIQSAVDTLHIDLNLSNELRRKYNPSNHTPDQKQVVQMMHWAWQGYSTYSYGYDSFSMKHLRGADNRGSHDMAITLIDSLDTLFLMGMFDEFDRASIWAAKEYKAKIYHSGSISFFETTIRILGGLLSAYYLSGQKHLLSLANELGSAMSPAFYERLDGLPKKYFNVMTKRGQSTSTLAEVGTLQLEFKYLAYATGNETYFNQVERISDQLAEQVKKYHPSGLLPISPMQHTQMLSGGKVTLGANGDSYYEYLLKQWLLSGKKDGKYLAEYMTAVDGIMDQLVAYSKPSGYVYIGELVNGKLVSKMDHLVCFSPGMLALGHYHGMPASHMELAKGLMETCYQMYNQMEGKLAPEIVYFNTKPDEENDIIVHARDDFNILRPETVESLFILYRITKDLKYRQYGKEIMEAFESNCRLERGGYTSVSQLSKGPVKQHFRDDMESFFLAETLKYLFLLFGDDETMCSLDEIVFNTEAHPFPIGAKSFDKKESSQVNIQQSTVSTGITIDTIVPGDGISFPVKGDTVQVHYVGTLLDGTKFDSSRDRGRPFEFKIGIGQVIRGWDEGLARMSKGQVAKLTLPYEYAYGEQGHPPQIPPKATLVFEVELISFFHPPPKVT